MDDVKEIYETWLHHPEKRTEEVWLAQMRLHYMKGEVDFQLKDRVRIRGYDPRIIMVVEDRLADYMDDPLFLLEDDPPYGIVCSYIYKGKKHYYTFPPMQLELVEAAQLSLI
jgi:hypothetical protein